MTKRATKRVWVFSLWCYKRSPKKTRQPSKTVTQVQFLTNYSNRLTDQALGKDHRVELDLDVLKKPRYLRMTKRATKRVWDFSLWCYQRSQRKTRQSSKTINQVQFLTKYSNRLTDQPLSKDHRVELDLDGRSKTGDVRKSMPY